MLTKEKREILSLLQDELEKVLLLYDAESYALKGQLINLPAEFMDLWIDEEIERTTLETVLKTIAIRTKKAEKTIDNIIRSWRSLRKGEK